MNWSEHPSRTSGTSEWRIAANFERRVLVIPPGCTRPFAAGEWRDAIGVVEAGTLEVEDTRGGVWHFGRGATLAFDGVALLHLRNPGREPITVVLVSRARHPDHDHDHDP